MEIRGATQGSCCRLVQGCTLPIYQGMCVEIVGATLIRVRYENVRGECSIDAPWPPSQSESVVMLVMLQLSMLLVPCQCIGLTIFSFSRPLLDVDSDQTVRRRDCPPASPCRPLAARLLYAVRVSHSPMTHKSGDSTHGDALCSCLIGSLLFIHMFSWTS